MIRSRLAVGLFGDIIRVAIAIVVFLLIGLAFLYHGSIIRFMYDKLHMNDFGKFYYSVRLFLDGEDMYALSPATNIPVSKTEVGHFLNMNPPHFHLLILPLAYLPPAAALQTWILMSLAAFVVSLWIISRELKLTWTPSGLLWTTLGILLFAGTSAVTVTGQLTFFLMLAFTVAWRAARRGEINSAARWLGLIASVKPFMAIFVLYFLVRRQITGVIAMALSGVVAFAAGLLVFGWDAHVSWVAAVSSANWTWPPMNGSLAGFFGRTLSTSPPFRPIFDAPSLARLLSFGVGAVIAVWSVRTLRSLSKRPNAQPATDRTFALLMMTSQLLTPLGWVYYLWVPAGPLLAIRRELAPHVRSWRTWILVAALPGALCPLFITALWEEPWVSVTLGSAYFWLTLALWTAVAFPPPLATSPAPDTPAAR